MELLPLHSGNPKTYLKNVLKLIIKLFIMREICIFVSSLTRTAINFHCDLEPLKKNE